MSSKVKTSRKSNMRSENTDGGKRSSSVVIDHGASKKTRVSTSTFVQNERQNIECNSHKRLNIAELDSRLVQNSHDKRKAFYRCIECTFASVSYDVMIVHCQHHIIDEAPVDVSITPITTIQTKVLGVKVDVDTVTYKEYKDNTDMNSHKFIDCDYKLLKSDKWPGIFDNMMKHEIDRINCTSIHYFTRIICLTSEKKASTAPFMLFKCVKCMKFIDPHSIVAHVQQNSCSELLKGFSCYECGRRFLTEISMYLHYKTHQAADASMKYITITFNYDHDIQVNTVLLKAAGINMQCEPKEKYNAVQQKSGTVQSQNGVINTIQQRPGKGQPQAEVNKTVHQAPSIVQSQVGVEKSQTTTHTMIIKGKNKTNESSKITHNILKDKVATIYKCQCEVCFHTLEDLFEHLKCCTSDFISKRKTCVCSLVFDEQNYEFHSNLHSQGFTKFIVKKVTVCDDKVIALNMPHEFKGNCEPKENKTNKELLATGKTNDITAQASKKDQMKIIEKPLSDEIHRKAIAQLIKTITNLSSMVTRGSDPKKFVKKQQQTTATSRRAADPKSDDSTDISVSVSMAATQTVHEANKVGITKLDEPGETNSIAQTDIDISEAVGTNQPITDASNGNLHSQNNTIYSDSGNNIEENQFMIDTTIKVKLTAKNKHEEHNKILNLEEIQGTPNINNNQETEAINAQSKKNNECEETTNENVVRDVECNIGHKANSNKPVVKEVAAESKIYTEDELLNEETPMYFDANSSLTDDEYPILLYDDDDDDEC